MEFDDTHVLDATRYILQCLFDDMNIESDPNLKMIGLNAFLSASQSWHMPDGTKTLNRPPDGTIVSQYDSKGGYTTWQWDDHFEQWFNVSSGKPTAHNTRTFPVGFELTLKEFECECGSEAVGSSKHSSWCKKFDNKQ